MSNKEKFKGFDFNHNPYEEEARQKWGDQAVDKSKQTLAKMNVAEKKGLGGDMEQIFVSLAEVRHLGPETEEAQTLIDEWYRYLTKIGDYTMDAFKGLGEMYVADERFTKNIDKYGEGLAQFMCKAMAIYAEQQTQK